jgi:ribosomal protein S18 acetylase RimI-like enzyme
MFHSAFSIQRVFHLPRAAGCYILLADELKARIGPGAHGNFLLGGFVEGRLCGMMGFFRDQNPKLRHRGHVWSVYVTAAARGQGLGRQLMTGLVERAAATEGIEQVVLSVSTTQVAAVRQYRSLGFESFGIEPRAMKIGDRYFDHEHMVLMFGR